MKQSLDLIFALLVMQTVVTWAQTPEKSASDPGNIRLENGEVIDLKVTPESRRKDIIILKSAKPISSN
jgi:hypothetical protein